MLSLPEVFPPGPCWAPLYPDSSGQCFWSDQPSTEWAISITSTAAITLVNKDFSRFNLSFQSSDWMECWNPLQSLVTCSGSLKSLIRFQSSCSSATYSQTVCPHCKQSINLQCYLVWKSTGKQLLNNFRKNSCIPHFSGSLATSRM